MNGELFAHIQDLCYSAVDSEENNSFFLPAQNHAREPRILFKRKHTETLRHETSSCRVEIVFSFSQYSEMADSDLAKKELCRIIYIYMYDNVYIRIYIGLESCTVSSPGELHVRTYRSTRTYYKSPSITATNVIYTIINLYLHML